MRRVIVEAAVRGGRSGAMQRSWAKRKQNAAIEAAWFRKPTCLCGCGETLARHRNPEQQRLFRQGHDARLKSVAAGVVAGDLQRHKIPEIATLLKARIGFLKTRPELAKAF